MFFTPFMLLYFSTIQLFYDYFDHNWQWNDDIKQRRQQWIKTNVYDDEKQIDLHR